MGGVIILEIVKASEITDFPTVLNGEIDREITLESSASWTQIEFVRGTCSLMEEPGIGQHGILWKGMVQGVISELTLEQRDELMGFLTEGIVARLTDSNNLVKILGNDELPAYLTFKEATGSNQSDRSQFTIQIQGEETKPAPVHSLDVIITESGAFITTEDDKLIYLE